MTSPEITNREVEISKKNRWLKAALYVRDWAKNIDLID